jgi:hypothetical protein
MTGSSLPSLASCVTSRPNFSSGWYRSSVGDALRPADLFQGREHLACINPECLEHPRAVAVLQFEQREKQVLGGDVLVLESFRLVLGLGQHLPRAHRRVELLVAAGNARPVRKRGLNLLMDDCRVGADLLDELGNQPLVLLQESQQDVLGVNLVVLETGGNALSGGNRLLRLLSKPIDVHIIMLDETPRRSIRARKWELSGWRRAAPGTVPIFTRGKGRPVCLCGFSGTE